MIRAALGTRPPATIAIEPVRAISGGGFRNSMVQYNIRGSDYYN